MVASFPGFITLKPGNRLCPVMQHAHIQHLHDILCNNYVQRACLQYHSLSDWRTVAVVSLQDYRSSLWTITNCQLCPSVSFCWAEPPHSPHTSSGDVRTAVSATYAVYRRASCKLLVSNELLGFFITIAKCVPCIYKDAQTLRECTNAKMLEHSPAYGIV